jgi:hypothetical protein
VPEIVNVSQDVWRIYQLWNASQECQIQLEIAGGGLSGRCAVPGRTSSSTQVIAPWEPCIEDPTKTPRLESLVLPTFNNIDLSKIQIVIPGCELVHVCFSVVGSTSSTWYLGRADFVSEHVTYHMFNN